MPLAADPAVQSMAVPAYFGPGSGWRRIDQSHPPLKVAVVNPDSGPGHARSSTYAAAIQGAKAAGVTVIGYVDTDYAHRSLSAVEADVSHYYHWYDVDGIFFDRASTKCAREPYYRQLDLYVKSMRGPDQTILNPGTRTHACYAGAANVLVTFEGSDASYLHSYSAPSWISRYPATQFWHIVYATPLAALAHTLALSRRRHAGFVYVTPLRLPNPYDALPDSKYWARELRHIEK